MKKNEKFNVSVGDVFVNSWGYDQTNVEYYQVIGLKGTSTAILKEIGSKRVDSYSSMSGTVKPSKDCFIEDSFFMCYESNKHTEKNLYIKRMQLGYQNNVYIKLGKHYNAYKTDVNTSNYESSYA